MNKVTISFAHPHAFGSVISLSGSFYWSPRGYAGFEWLPAMIANTPAPNIKLYLAVGLLETIVSPRNFGHYMLATNRHMRDVLTARGYTFRYREFNGVHHELNWQLELAEGLRYLLDDPNN